MPHKNDGKTVAQILQGKKGSIKDAPLEPGSPTWQEIDSITLEEVVTRASANEPGYKMIKKLLGDKRFDK
jgi:hypothetical protein